MYSVGTLFTGLYFPDSPGTLYSKGRTGLYFPDSLGTLYSKGEQVYIS